MEFNRDKQIEEMAKTIASTLLGTVKPDLTLTEMGEVYKGEFIGRIAKHLYSEGYRKSTDVAEEIFAEIEKITVKYRHGYEFDSHMYELKKKYTVGEKE